MRYEHHPVYPLLDPSAPDFRSFFAYTPNEVKHRRRTTTAQLKVLESVFKNDTKPNASKRNALAATLNMTARGVQVWFQNRRAKEKNKANKLGKGCVVLTPSADQDDTPPDTPPAEATHDDPDVDATSIDPTTPVEEVPEDHFKSESPPEFNQDIFRALPPTPTSSNVFTNDVPPRPASACSWQPPSANDPPSGGLPFPSRRSLADIHAQRRVSLPANTFFHEYSTHAPLPLDAWDSSTRRRSVDTSLQRLKCHPYAKLAQKTNAVMFGPSSPAPSPDRLLQQRKSVPTHLVPPSHYFDARRASVGSDTPVRSWVDGSSPLNHIRASMPDASMYASARRYIPQIPGPLPSPNYIFGTITDDDDDDVPPSPHLSTYSFPARDDNLEDDDAISNMTYDTFSRFGSVASFATSASSLFSGVPYDLGPAPGDPVPDIERRNSCTSQNGQLTSGIDVAPPSAPGSVSDYTDEDPIHLATGSQADLGHSPTNDGSISPLTSPATITASLGSSPVGRSTPTSPVHPTVELALALDPASGKLSGNQPTLLDDKEQLQQLPETPSHTQQLVSKSETHPLQTSPNSETNNTRNIVIGSTQLLSNAPAQIDDYTTQYTEGFDFGGPISEVNHLLENGLGSTQSACDPLASLETCLGDSLITNALPSSAYLGTPSIGMSQLRLG